MPFYFIHACSGNITQRVISTDSNALISLSDTGITGSYRVVTSSCVTACNTSVHGGRWGHKNDSLCHLQLTDRKETRRV